MTKIWLDWSDGRYSTRLLTDEEAQEREAMNLDVAYVEDTIWQAYLRDCERDAIWQAYWRAISNEHYMRRREKELQPLEDAQREIERLKYELATAKRMEAFYEEQYAKNLRDRHREKYVEYTCIFPQPGCKIEVLRPEWQERAQEIMEQYNAARMEGSLKYQGCCCGHEHKLLDAVEAGMLRAAGFLVENATEVV
jgi:hypothetical protein